MDYKNHISIDTTKHFDKPIITGAQISVSKELNWFTNGMSTKEIINVFPELDVHEIRTLQAYSAARERSIKVM